ncbi:MAG: hypothetical protein WKG07_38450 [Hymenobacter sp.]
MLLRGCQNTEPKRSRATRPPILATLRVLPTPAASPCVNCCLPASRCWPTLAAAPVSAQTQTQAPTKLPVRVGDAGLTHAHVHGLLGRAKKGDVEIVGIAEANREAPAQRFAKQYGFSMTRV